MNRRSRLAHDEIIAVHRFRDVRLLTLQLLQFALKLRDFLLASFFLLDFFLTQAFLLQQRLFSLLLALFLQQDFGAHDQAVQFIGLELVEHLQNFMHWFLSPVVFLRQFANFLLAFLPGQNAAVQQIFVCLNLL